jgi:hypothetical protein
LTKKKRFDNSPGVGAVINSLNIYFLISLKREDFAKFYEPKGAIGFVMEKIKSAHTVKMNVEDLNLLERWKSTLF